MAGLLKNEIYDWIVQLLNNNLGKLDEEQSEFTSEQKLAKVWYGEQAVISKYPAIRVNPGPVTSEWGATRVQDDTYNFVIEVYVKCPKKEVASEWLYCLTQAIRNILLDPNNLSFKLKSGQTVYDGYCSSADPLVDRGEAIFSSSLGVFYKSWVTDKNI